MNNTAIGLLQKMLKTQSSKLDNSNLDKYKSVFSDCTIFTNNLAKPTAACVVGQENSVITEQPVKYEDSA